MTACSTWKPRAHLAAGCVALLLLGASARCAPTPLRQAPESQAPQGAAEPPVPLVLGLMWPLFPEGTPPSREQVALGRELFLEPALSRDGTTHCATCHREETSFADPQPVSLGVGGTPGTRNTPTLLNAAYFDSLGWTGEHASLEAQSLAAITSPREMALPQEQIAPRVEAKYGARLRALYGEASAQSVAAALGAYQRSLISGDSPFDRYIYLREKDAITESAQRGFAVFLGQARCVQCHFMRSEASHPFGGKTGLYTDGRFHNLGVGFDEHGGTRDWGRYEVTKSEEDRGAFKTPTLRNVELTAPYMHDGSMKTLEEVIEHYNKGGIPNRHLDPDIRPLHLTDQQKADLVAFLKALTSTQMR